MRLRATSTRQSGGGGIGATAAPPIWGDAMNVLAKYAPNAHLWIPGVGVVNGIDVGNWLETSGGVQAMPDYPVARVDDCLGTYGATQSSLANRPILRESPHRWQFDGVNDSLSLPLAPFNLADDFCVIAGAALNSTGASKAIYGQSNLSNHAVPELLFDGQGRVGVYAMGGGATLSSFGGPSNVGAGPIVASMRNIDRNVVVRRNGTQAAGIQLSGTYGLPLTASIGAFPSLTTSRFLDGEIYPVIVIKGTVTDQDLITLERFAAECSGVTL